MPKRNRSVSNSSPSKKKNASPIDMNKHSEQILNKSASWCDDEIVELLAKIEENIPEDDVLSHSSRLEKFNWENIFLENRSAEECKKQWLMLYKKVRKFRRLGEILTDIKELAKKPQVGKHPNKPKQPWNSYMFFIVEQRQKVVAESPELSPVEVSKRLGQMYKHLPIEERKKYEQLAHKAREEYNVKLELFYQEYPEMIGQKTNTSSRKSSIKHSNGGPPEKPKKPYDLFVQTEGDKSYESRSIMLQECKQRWTSFTDKEKFFWINWSEELHTKYLQDVKEYAKSHPDYKPEPISILTKKEKEIKERCSGKPEKPPHSPYHLFGKMMMESKVVEGMSPKDVMHYVAEKWRACSEEDKKAYKERLDQMWEEYQVKLEAYGKTLPPGKREALLEDVLKRKKNNKKEAVKEKVSREKLPKPVPPPLTYFKYFEKVYDGSEEPDKVWKSMYEEQREVYKDRLRQERKEYISQYEKYLKTLSREELEKLGAELGTESDSERDSCCEGED